MKDIYIHYGSTHFRPEAFKTPRNQNWVKPIGGLWACLKNDERAYTWKDWNESEGFTDCCEDTSFSFTLKDTANVHYIYNSIDLKDILHEYPVGTSLITSYIDFEDLVKRGIDAIELRKTINNRVEALQKKQQAQAEQETAKVEAKTALIKAQNEAEIKITQAKAEAEANKVKAASITEELIRMKEAEARYKHGWVTVNGNSTVVTKEGEK